MLRFGKSLLATILISSFLTMPCFAAQNYNYTTRVQYDNPQAYVVRDNYYDNYSNNYYTNYNTPRQAVNYAPYPPNGYYNNYNAPVNYNVPVNGYAAQNMYYPAPVQAAEPYQGNVTVTQSYTDTREKVDKNISRAGSIATIVGGLALVGAVATSIIRK